MGKRRRQWPIGMSFDIAGGLELADMNGTGVSCIELTSRTQSILLPEVKHQCDSLVKDARKRGVEIYSFHLPYGHECDPSSPDASVRAEVRNIVAQIAEYAAEWGISRLILHPSFEPIPAADRAQRLKIAREMLGELARLTAVKGVTLAAECLPRTCLGHSAGEIEYLLEGNDELMVCCDVNHLFKESPQSFIRQIGSRIVATHISDNDGVDERHRLPGQGIIDWPAVIAALEDVGYRGAFMYEVRNQTVAGVEENWRLWFED